MRDADVLNIVLPGIFYCLFTAMGISFVKDENDGAISPRMAVGVALWPIFLVAATILGTLYVVPSLCYMLPVSLIRNRWVAWPHERWTKPRSTAPKAAPPPSDPYLEAATQEVEQLLH